MDSWEFKVLYDGECPFCMLEVRWMKKINRVGRLSLEDIAGPGFDPSKYGTTLDSLMGSIHGFFPDGRMVQGMETFRQAYRALGIGWVIAPTGWPVFRPIFDLLYVAFARSRVRLGGLFGRSCESGRCAIPGSRPVARPLPPE